MNRYVLGFAFDASHGPQVIGNANVALIRKIKPEWQAGSLNGIGGSVEDYDHGAWGAMVREFEEETGFSTTPGEWSKFHTMSNGIDAKERWHVTCFRTFGVPLRELKTTTGEEVVLVNAYNLPADVLFNLRWLIPLALDPEPYPTEQRYR